MKKKYRPTHLILWKNGTFDTATHPKKYKNIYAIESMGVVLPTYYTKKKKELKGLGGI